VIYLDADELNMHLLEVFGVGRPWQNLNSRLLENLWIVCLLA